MPTYAIGDIQGCHRSLAGLLERIEFAPDRDRLWLVGDLVNRGPRSLGVLRWAADMPERSLVVVLGNHDLYLLARVLAGARKKSRDTLADVMDARDRDRLIEWLRHRPLVHVEGADVLVHAGLHPSWSVSDACALASEAEAILRSDRVGKFLDSKSWAAPPDWSPALENRERAASILAHLTRLRMFGDTGKPEWDYTGAPGDAPKGFRAWFDMPDRATRDARIFFGHWASLGLFRDANVNGLDSGCVYGRMLTAIRLEDGAVIQQPCKD